MKGIVKTTVMMMVFVFAATVSRAEMLQIKGSDTLINLVQKLSEEYMKDNPGKFIAVTGGGSGTGIAALINKKCDIANASRTIKSSEIEMARTAGLDPKRVVIAIDGLAVIVNAGNPVTQLTMDEIGKIFRGEVTNWSEVGGSDGRITLYGRQPNSGTFDFFREVVLKSDYSLKMNQMNGNAQIVEAVKSDPNGIGYVGVGYVQDHEGLNVLKVSTSRSLPYASPLNEEAVKTGVYPISRPLNQYIGGAITPDIKAFLAYEVSSKGQKIVKEEGFFPIPGEYEELNQKAGL